MAEYTVSSRRGSGGTVTPECIQELLDFFIKNAYKARNVDQRVSLESAIKFKHLLAEIIVYTITCWVGTGR